MGLFTSYLKNRKHSVEYNYNISSDSKTIKCGIPQGSTLESILFILYVNDTVYQIVSDGVCT